MPLPLLGLLAAVGPLALSAGSVATLAPAEAAYRALPELPAGSTDHSAAGVEATAVALAASLGAVPVDALGGVCDAGDLRVSWDDPGDQYEIGAHVTPLGPEPGETTLAVNGIVVCLGSTYAYMGFEAKWADDRWDVVDVPYVGAEEDEGVLVAQPAPVVPEGPHPVPTLTATGTLTGAIEGYAAYEPQRTCDPTAKAGTRALAGALLRDYAGSRNLGIVRGCSVGGRSEHKEGRAFDWGVNITNPNEKAAADTFIAALLATDAAGNRHALARRMGLMYIIWNRQIWSSYRASEGWRPYSGSSAHRDHVHISLSWAGAQGRTSFWSGTVPPDLPTASPVTANVSARSGSHGTGDWSAPTATATGGGGGGRHGRHRDDAAPSTHLNRDQLAAGVRALWHDGVPPTAAEIEAWLVSVGVSAEWAHQYAGWAAERAERRATTPTTDAPEADDTSDDGHDGSDDGWEAERQRRHDAWVAEQERRRQEREAREAAEEARRQAEADAEAADDAPDEPDTHVWQPEQPVAPAPTVPQPPSGGSRHGGWGGGGRHGGRGGGGGHQAPTTTVPPATTTTAAPTTTTEAPTTTTEAPTTTSTPGG